MKYDLERIPSKRNGYYLVKAPKDYPGVKYDKRYTAEHRAVWWLHHGYLPPKGYHIHHINGDKTDNRIENLEAIHVSVHVKQKGHVADLEPAKKMTLECHQCKKSFEKLESVKRYSEKLGQDFFFCGKSCQVSYQNQFKKGKKNNYPKDFKRRPVPMVTLSCHACAKKFEVQERIYKARLKAGSKKFSCSRSCVNKKSLTHDYGIGVCETCKKLFQKQTAKHNMYCGSQCRSRAHYLKTSCVNKKDCVTSK